MSIYIIIKYVLWFNFYDKDGCLLQALVHIEYYMLWYFAVIKYVFEIDKGKQF